MGWKEKLQQFKELLNIIRDREDITQKFAFLFDPKNIKTSTRLNASQVEFVADSFTATSYYPEFKPLQDLAKEVSEVMISHKGAGRGEAIDFQKASRPTQTPSQFGIFTAGKDGKEKKKKETKE